MPPLTIDGRPVTGIVAELIREILRHADRIEAPDVTRVTAYIKSKGGIVLGIEERLRADRN